MGVEEIGFNIHVGEPLGLEWLRSTLGTDPGLGLQSDRTLVHSRTCAIVQNDRCLLELEPNTFGLRVCVAVCNPIQEVLDMTRLLLRELARHTTLSIEFGAPRFQWSEDDDTFMSAFSAEYTTERGLWCAMLEDSSAWKATRREAIRHLLEVGRNRTTS